MITIICGKPGAGKTALLTYFAVQSMIETGFQDYRNCCKEIEMLKAGGFSLLEPPPQRHVCFADFSVKYGRVFKPYYCDGFEIGHENPFFKTKFFPPYSKIFLDEAQRYYDSRMSKYLREDVYHWYQTHRHNDMDVYMVCQRLANIDLNIRGIAERFIVIDKLEVKENDWGQIEDIKWKIRTFYSPELAESYQLSTEKKEKLNIGEVSEIKTDLNVFRCYDSKSCKPLFYNMRYNQAFDYWTDAGYEMTRESFIEFNNNHRFSAPRGYWKNAKYDEQILQKMGVV